MKLVTLGEIMKRPFKIAASKPARVLCASFESHKDCEIVFVFNVSLNSIWIRDLSLK